MTGLVSWPDDYVKLDSGRLWIHPAWSGYLAPTESATVESLLQATFAGRLLRRRDDVSGWDNVCWIPEEVPGSPTIYVKRHRSPSPHSPALQEAQAVSLCQLAQAPCMEVLAVGQRPEGTVDATGRRFSSFFMSPAIGEGLSASQAILELLKAGASDDELMRIVEAVAWTVGRFHSANLFHGDCHFVHFLMDGQDSPQARVIDLQGMRVAHGFNGYYRWLKDMGQLRFSLIRLGVYRRLADRWYAAYGSSIDSAKIQKWIDHSGRLKISLRGDWRLLRRIISNLIKRRFPQAKGLVQDRLRAA